jgi:multidrug resistance efflux pump
MKNVAKKLKNRGVIRVIIGIVLIVIIVGSFLYWQSRKDRVFIEDSLVTGTLITIAPTTSGQLTEMDAQAGKMLKKGDVIAIVGSNTIRSTTDGLVVSANNQIGGSVTPQSQLVQLVDPAQMRVAGTIDENKGLDQVKVGQVASFTVDAYPGQTFWGYVDEISQTAKTTQASFSISSERPTQQFQVYLRFNATAYPQLKNGMSAKMTIYTNTQ